jgi:hypothetical protein
MTLLSWADEGVSRFSRSLVLENSFTLLCRLGLVGKHATKPCLPRHETDAVLIVLKTQMRYAGRGHVSTDYARGDVSLQKERGVNSACLG